ncbi:MAG: DUF6020 family protein [Defluviitaleaceae bacterium]|nr:DUF6020 family protein [Defluviitaleaceae bacterium]
MIKIAICIALTLLSSFAFMLSANPFGGAVFAVVVFWLYMQVSSVRRAEFVFAILISIAYVIGISFTRYNAFFGALHSLVIFAGFVPFFYAAVCLLADKVLAFTIENSGEGRFSNFFAPFILFLIAWLPYFFIYFPGNLINDSVRQLAQFEGLAPYSNHHPIISTFFMGIFYRIGGLALITIIHNMMMAAAFSLALIYLKKWGIAYRVRLVVMLFFAVFPVFGIWAQTILKDTHAAAVMLMFVLFYIDLLRRFSRRRLFLCLVAAVVASLFRNEVVFVVVPSILALIFVHTRRKRRVVLAACAIGVFIVVRLIVGGATAVTDAERGSVREALSVPFQQTARFMRYHQLTDTERAVLAATFENYYLLGELYDPRISDPVKNRFIEGADLGAYFRTWAAMGLRAPRTYLEAAIAVSFSYVVPFGPDWMIVWWESSHDVIPLLERDDIGYAFSNPEMRVLPVLGMEFLGRLPIIGAFFHTGNYTWAMAFLALLLVNKKMWSKTLYFLPALMIILACMASPVHGFWRYYLPILFMFPVLSALVLKELQDDTY